MNTTDSCFFQVDHSFCFCLMSSDAKSILGTHSRWKHQLGFYPNLSRLQCAVTGGCHGDAGAERRVAVVGSGLASPGEGLPQQVIKAALCAVVGGRLDFQKIWIFFKDDKTAIRKCLGFYRGKTELERVSFNPQKSHCKSTSGLLHFKIFLYNPPFPPPSAVHPLSKRTPSLNPPCCHPSLLVWQEGSAS